MDNVGSILGREKIIVLLVYSETLCADVVKAQEVSPHVLPSFGTQPLAMKNKKATKKFAASGKLKQTIQARHKQQKLKKQIDGRRQRRAAKEQNAEAGVKRIAAEDVDMDGDDSDEEPSRQPKVSSKGKSKVKQVDAKKSFLDGEDDEVRHELALSYLILIELQGGGEGNETDDAEGDSASEEGDAASFASIDDLEGEIPDTMLY